MMDVKEKIERYFESHKEEYLEDLAKLIAIDSSRSEEKPGMPFGEGPAEVLKTALEIAEKYGFYTENHDNYFGIVQLNNEKERKLDILGHLDVVPADNDWEITAPFEMKIKDGRVYGRGTADDKGPVLAAMYALRAIKELKLPLKNNVRLFLGCNEESGAADTRKYFKEIGPAEMTLTPDSDFPVVNIEKGSLTGIIESSHTDNGSLPRVLSIEGGKARNIICGECTAMLEGLSLDDMQDAIEKACAETGVDFIPEDMGNGIVCVKAIGVSAHAASPKNGNNANTAMLHLLHKLPIARSEGYERLCTLNDIFPHGDTCGKAAGIYMKDDISGEITVCLNILKYSRESLYSLFDARLPVCADEENLKPVGEKVTTAGFKWIGNRSEAHHVPEESPFIQTLLKTYEEFAGEKGYCIAMGGGTYCHSLANGVAFGMAMRNKGVQNMMHGRHEFAEIDTLMMGGKIYASVILKLCNDFD